MAQSQAGYTLPSDVAVDGGEGVGEQNSEMDGTAARLELGNFSMQPLVRK